MSELTFVQKVLRAWAGLAAELSPLGIASNVSALPNGSKGVVEIQSQEHLALIEVWEHAHCLDTTLHQERAATGTILAAGPCTSWHEAEERLQALRAALCSQTAR
jgi:hypothetical protein